ncbi:MAG: Veg family protein [Synergistetes bacterium]|nr:Veg family protein [Synergistota bacterium]
MAVDSLAKIKRTLENYIGEDVRIRDLKGRRKKEENRGTIHKLYTHFFIVQLNQKNRRVSYRYTDLFTGEIELYLCSEERRIF